MRSCLRHPLATRFWASQCLAWPKMRPFLEFRLAARAQPLLGSLQKEVVTYTVMAQVGADPSGCG